MRHLQLSQISQSQSLHFADTIPVHFPAISSQPTVFASNSNPLLTSHYNLAAAAALTAIIISLANQTCIGPITVPTTNLKVVWSMYSVKKLSHDSDESNISLVCQLSKWDTSAALSTSMI